MDAYWARLLFSGRSAPPEEVNSPEKLVMGIKGTMQGIGYISSRDLTNSLKVVYRFEKF
ncbi:hypothetical protein HWQ46_05345 [Shewanella sp. D64]|uniref:hypothetical protein n=1 Tax=unclassified Shewanella TaxID=196818 RepID=UPI0022BA2F88|nr:MULTISPECIES: hypothetical protein [unclassified Shewanella]MEC4724977.1 hypothetical protein [Shewanella sp. D64]MEC4736878.1 hypothetical protein [Shewanella sp. E94]WBJ96476.1 hypothetical protein HWQ47_04950 [Shewanella sp. MTB7]